MTSNANHCVDTATTARTVSMLCVLANSTRLGILNYLMSGERYVAQIDASLSIGPPNLSQQLAELRGTGTLAARRGGKAVFYRLDNERVHKLISLLLSVIGRDEFVTVIDSTQQGKRRVGAAYFALVAPLDETTSPQ